VENVPYRRGVGFMKFLENGSRPQPPTSPHARVHIHIGLVTFLENGSRPQPPTSHDRCHDDMKCCVVVLPASDGEYDETFDGCAYVYIYTHGCVCVYVCVYMYIRAARHLMAARMYIYTHIYMHTHPYTHTHACTSTYNAGRDATDMA